MPADIDALLLDRVFQPSADRLASSMSCFGLARVTLASAVLLQTVVLIEDLQTFSDPVMRTLAGIITIVAFVGADQGRKLIVRVERQARSGMMNVRRITLRWQRLAWLAMCAWTVATASISADAASVMIGSTCLAWVATIYFVSCTPQPPRLADTRRRAQAGPFDLSRCTG